MECEDNIIRTQAKLGDIAKKKYKTSQLVPILDDAITTLCRLAPIYPKSAVNDKRRLMDSMLPEKFDIETLQHRTALVSETFQRIYLINKKLEYKKNGQKTVKNLLPRYGSVAVRNSNHFVDELIEIGGFYKILDE